MNVKEPAGALEKILSRATSGLLVVFVTTFLGACGNGGSGSSGGGSSGGSNPDTVTCYLSETGQNYPVRTTRCRANKHIWECRPSGQWTDLWQECNR